MMKGLGLTVEEQKKRQDALEQTRNLKLEQNKSSSSTISQEKVLSQLASRHKSTPHMRNQKIAGSGKQYYEFSGRNQALAQ